MIRLSAEQTRALEDLALQRFIRRVADELPAYRGPLVADRDESVLFAVAAEAVDRGRGFGLQSERALFQYANLSVTLGVAFDSDPALPWAKPIVVDDSYLGNEKMDDLWNAYMDYCGAVMEGGDEEFFPRQAFRNYKAFRALPANDGTLTPVVADLSNLWPEKAGLIGSDAVEAHLREAGKRATKIGLRSFEARGQFCRIAFLLGYAFDADPLHNWVWPVLDGLGTDVEATIMESLEQRFVAAVIDPCLNWQDEIDEEEQD